MESIKQLTPFLSVRGQIREADLGAVAAAGFRAIINNRPDGEAEDQPPSEALEKAAASLGMTYRHVPVKSGEISDADVEAFRSAVADLRGPVLGFCRTGTRTTTLWALSEANRLHPDAVLATCAKAGYDISGIRPRLEAAWDTTTDAALAAAALRSGRRHDVLIVGGGAAGIATAASLLRRRPGLDIAIIEPRDKHYYQPGWTLVGGGVFDRAATERSMQSVMPKGVKWIEAAAAAFEPEHNQVVLEDGSRIGYRVLVAAPGIQLNWDAIEGLRDTLGKHGVTSNYQFDLAPYTWQLVQGLKNGRAIFTQPPMPIKCAGAPQKAMYLSCDQWLRAGALKDIDVEFHTAGAVLFGVATFVPPLMAYVEKYGANLNFNSNLKRVDGPARKAWFEMKDADGNTTLVERQFDMLHVCPPQSAPDFVKRSPLADAAGWIEVNHETLQHVRYRNVFGLGDACSAPNAKTAAAVRKQAPLVAENVLATLSGRGPRAVYDGYGSCPLTVERGKVVLAEFGYGGKLLPSFPLKADVPRRSMWWLKAKAMPGIYFDMMLKGREYLAKPTLLPHDPTEHETAEACDYTGTRK